MSLFYQKNGDIIEIIVRDATMCKVGTWKFNANDKKLASGIFTFLQNKYGFSPEIKPEDNVKSKDDKDDFLNMNVDW